MPQLYYKLYEYIIQILLNKKAYTAPELRCYDALKRIDFLCQKGLMDQAAYWLDKIVNYVILIDRNDLLLTIMNYAQRMNNKVEIYDYFTTNTRKLMTDFEKVFSDLNEWQLYKRDYTFCYENYMKKRLLRDQHERELLRLATEYSSRPNHLKT